MERSPVARTLLELLRAHALQRAAAPAILAPGRQTLTYGRLGAEIERAADALAAFGFGRGNRIAVALPTDPEAGVALLCAIAVATCAPLAPDLDFESCMRLLRRMRIDVVIVGADADTPIVAAAKALALPLLRLARRPDEPCGVFDLAASALQAGVSDISRDGQRGAPQPGDVALVMPTSGTTAEPKIVPATHAQLAWSVLQQPIGVDDRALHVAPLHTRSGLGLGLLAPIAAGASVVITGGYDAACFVDWLDTFRPTYYSASPTVQLAVIDALVERAPRTPHSLRFVRASSSALPPAVQQRLEALLGVPVIQGYGMTESGLVAQNPLPPRERRPASAGLVTATELMIRGDDGASLPRGAVGEILVRGTGVMPGYEGDPEANARAFVDGWFRTGDLGYLDEDGYLYLTGRIRELINRGGLKVSPSELDELFLRHPDVREAATFGIPHASLGEDVVTAVVLRATATTTGEQLREFALRRLAAHKVPSSVLIVAQLPKNAAGKVVRGALKTELEATVRADYVAPRDECEALVARLYAELLGLPRVGALDHFFHLGGDSLRAAQMVARVAAATGREVELPALFEAPTVALFAARLRAALSDGAAGDAAPLARLRRSVVRAPVAAK
jgi:acyl-CoA synthetase (AMP-forming)/AMP-acid ligase II